MNWWLLGGAIAIAILLFVAHRLGWIDMSNKNRSSGTHGGVMGIGDEVFHPTRHEAQIELERQTVLPAPAPLAGDGDKGIFNGKVVIDLSKDRRS
jgi:hypothetical protein